MAKMTVENLTREQKRLLLEHIETQLGYSKYREIVSAVGEDGLLEAFLEQAQGSSAGKTTQQNEESPWLIALSPWAYLWLPIIFSSGLPGVLIVICLYLIVVILIYLWRARSKVLPIILTIGLLGACGVAVWKIGPWLYQGVVMWWKWLGGHF